MKAWTIGELLHGRRATRNGTPIAALAVEISWGEFAKFLDDFDRISFAQLY